MEGKVVQAMRRAAERGDFDDLLSYATMFNTPEAQKLFAEARALFALKRQHDKENLAEFRRNFNECVNKGMFDGFG